MSGALPPVLLLHGWGGSYESTWVANGWPAAFEAAGRQVIAIDLPGHGAAGGPVDAEAYADLAGQVSERLPKEGLLDVVGYSLGAKLTLALAERDLGRFRRLVVAGLGGNAFAPERLGESVAAALEDGLRDDTPAPVRKLVDYALSAGNDARAVAAVLRRPPNPVLDRERLMWLRSKTLLIAGDHDAIAMPLEPLREALSHASCRVLPGVDHLGLPASRAFREAALAFLDGA